ncbi:GNAT family N-acetyltransferase [Senegalia sp. (in: firmicutes)]|uniref:GNAT family N-acetyltransferase n=2 Tax=Senegalia sp. (in: firmicutes) TaxID=1924098 RepID=UPI003F94E2AD
MELRICKNEDKEIVSPMIVELMNYHRKLTKAPEEYWCTIEKGEQTFNSWLKEGNIYLAMEDRDVIGFFYLEFGGDNAAWLEDLYILKKYRKKGLGKKAMSLLDNMLINENVTALFVDVIPRNISAIEFYREIGFDHLNMIQLRKNYDSRLNKKDSVEILGYNFKKY